MIHDPVVIFFGGIIVGFAAALFALRLYVAETWLQRQASAPLVVEPPSSAVPFDGRTRMITFEEDEITPEPARSARSRRGIHLRD